MKKLLFLVLFPGFVLAATEKTAETTPAPRVFVESATEKLMEYAHPAPCRRLSGPTLEFVRAQLEAGADPEKISSKMYELAPYSAYSRALQDYNLGVLTMLLAYGCNPNEVRNLRAPRWDNYSPISGILLGEDITLGTPWPMVELLIIFGFDLEKVYWKTALEDIVQPIGNLPVGDIVKRKEDVQRLLDQGAYQGFDKAYDIVKCQKDSSEKKFNAVPVDASADSKELGDIKDAWSSMASVFEKYSSAENRAAVKDMIESHKTKSMVGFLRQWAEERHRSHKSYGRLLTVLSYPGVQAKLADFRPYEVKRAK